MKDYNYQFLGGLQLTLWDNEGKVTCRSTHSHPLLNAPSSDLFAVVRQWRWPQRWTFRASLIATSTCLSASSPPPQPVRLLLVKKRVAGCVVGLRVLGCFCFAAN